jgi:hypothetical protein
MVLISLDLDSASKGFEVATDSQLPLLFEGPLALLTVEEIYDRVSVDLLQRLKEDRRIERKPAGMHSQSLGEYFSMWANTAPDGGIVVIGMEDGGAVGVCLNLSQKELNRIVWVPEILARQFRKFWHVLLHLARPLLSSGDGCARRFHRGG